MNDITPKEIEFINLIKSKNIPIDFFFDVGLNEGEYTQFMLINFDIREVHVFEPNEELLNITKTKLNNYLIEYNNVAIDIEEGKKEINILPEYTGMSSLYYREKAFKEFEVVKKEINTIRLDSYISNKFNFISSLSIRNSFIKIDIEGNELNAIKSLGGWLSNIGIIQFEYGGCWIDSKVNMQDLIEYIKDTNIKLCDLVDGKILEIKEFSSVVNYHDFNNYFLIRDDIFKKLT